MDKIKNKQRPSADRMRLINLDEFIGQEEVIGKDYKYSPDHDYNKKQDYLPEAIKNRKYFS
ncbi:MAG: hypothetical protein U9Q85_00285 [Patescibacteria group bacterium]|nr:hypothetical protein [Patescibacteria group bacterium]